MNGRSFRIQEDGGCQGMERDRQENRSRGKAFTLIEFLIVTVSFSGDVPKSIKV